MNILNYTIKNVGGFKSTDKSAGPDIMTTVIIMITILTMANIKVITIIIMIITMMMTKILTIQMMIIMMTMILLVIPGRRQSTPATFPHPSWLSFSTQPWHP